MIEGTYEWWDQYFRQVPADRSILQNCLYYSIAVLCSMVLLGTATAKVKKRLINNNSVLVGCGLGESILSVPNDTLKFSGVFQFQLHYEWWHEQRKRYCIIPFYWMETNDVQVSLPAAMLYK